jgi:hypothetical protein
VTDQRTAEALRLREHFRVPVWWGTHTRSWWAMVPDGDGSRLIEAADPRQLAEAISQAQAALRPLARPSPGQRRQSEPYRRSSSAQP